MVLVPERGHFSQQKNSGDKLQLLKEKPATIKLVSISSMVGSIVHPAVSYWEKARRIQSALQNYLAYAPQVFKTVPAKQ